MLNLLRRKIFGPSIVDKLMEAERQAERAAQQKPEAGSPAEVYDEREWIQTRTLDDEIMPVEDMRRFKRLRAILNYDEGTATESDLDCLSQEERDRLESIAIQGRWDRFLGRPQGVDIPVGRYFR